MVNNLFSSCYLDLRRKDIQSAFFAVAEFVQKKYTVYTAGKFPDSDLLQQMTAISNAKYHISAWSTTCPSPLKALDTLVEAYEFLKVHGFNTEHPVRLSSGTPVPEERFAYDLMECQKKIDARQEIVSVFWAVLGLKPEDFPFAKK